MVEKTKETQRSQQGKVYCSHIQNKYKAMGQQLDELRRLEEFEKRISERKDPFDDGKTIFEKMFWVMGQSIFEHDLIKPYPHVARQVRQCITTDQILEILKRQDFRINGRVRRLPK